VRGSRPWPPSTSSAAASKRTASPDIPDEFGEKKKRPREVAFMDVNLCFAPSVTFSSFR
jgi:hypothetical protein